jgi:hypothetical protein
VAGLGFGASETDAPALSFCPGWQPAATVRALNGFPMRKAEIIVTDNGFAIVTPKGIDTVSLDEVSAILAYKRDELATDLICCDIVTGPAGGEQVRTIHEEIPGFNAVMARLESLPGFDRQWRKAVILPPFAENRTIIFKRAAAA